MCIDQCPHARAHARTCAHKTRARTQARTRARTQNARTSLCAVARCRRRRLISAAESSSCAACARVNRHSRRLAHGHVHGHLCSVDACTGMPPLPPDLSGGQPPSCVPTPSHSAPTPTIGRAEWLPAPWRGMRGSSASQHSNFSP